MGKELSIYNLSYKHIDELESHLKGSPLAPLLMYVHHQPQRIYQPWTQYLIILCFPWTFSCEKNAKQLIKYVVESTWKKLCNKAGTLNILAYIFSYWNNSYASQNVHETILQLLDLTMFNLYAIKTWSMQLTCQINSFKRKCVCVCGCKHVLFPTFLWISHGVYYKNSKTIILDLELTSHFCKPWNLD